MLSIQSLVSDMKCKECEFCKLEGATDLFGNEAEKYSDDYNIPEICYCQIDINDTSSITGDALTDLHAFFNRECVRPDEANLRRQEREAERERERKRAETPFVKPEFDIAFYFSTNQLKQVK